MKKQWVLFYFLILGVSWVGAARAAEIKPGTYTAKASGLRGTVTVKGASSPELQIAGGSKITVSAPDKNGLVQVELHSGLIRIKVKAAEDHKPIFNLKTKAAVMGVRGTDFIGIATPILGESEIVVMDGVVEFTSTSDAKDTRSISKGHWGGIGGRFGARTHDLIALSPEQLQHFDQASTVK